MRLLRLVWLILVPALAGCIMPRPWKYLAYEDTCAPAPDAPASDAQLFVTLRLPHCNDGRTRLTHYRSKAFNYASSRGGRITIHSKEPWVTAFRARTGGRLPLIFIHGYNNSNEAALERSARLAKALAGRAEAYPVIPITWSSYGGLPHYYWDEANAEWTVAEAVKAVAELTREFPETMLLAHSMGNRLALAAVEDLKARGRLAGVRQFIMAAPDVDRQWLEQKLRAPGALGVPTTIYVSLRDQPLSLSWRGHGYPRAGDFSWWVSGRDRTFAFAWIDGVQVVDTTNVDRTLKGHSYFVESPRVAEDICRVVHNKGPGRRGIEAVPVGGAPSNYVQITKASVPDECWPTR